MVKLGLRRFDQLLTQWDSHGNIQILNNQATLREDNPLLANLSQTAIAQMTGLSLAEVEALR
jgi:hypothetical protein